MSERARGYAWVLAGASSYGLVSSIVKLTYRDGLASATIATFQSILGFSMLLALLVARRLAGVRTAMPSRRDLVGTLALGASTGITAIFYYGALERLTASLAILLLFQFTWMGVLAEAVLARRVPDRASLASLVLAWVGTIFGAGVLDGSAAHIDPRGAAYGIGAGVAYTVFVVGTSRVGTAIAAFERSALMAFAALVVLLVAFPPRFLLTWTAPHALLPWATCLGFFGVIVPNVAFALGSPRIGGERASIVSAVELPVAILAAHFILGERTSLAGYTGVALILVAVTLPELARARRAEG